MSYIIKKTDNTIVASITDGTIDTANTSLTLIGKNYKGIGEIYNTNLVKLLENFANSSPPSRQIKGQLWFNSNTSKLNVYDGSNWRPVGSPFVSTAKPGNLVSGDLWIDSASQQLKFYDGSNLVTAGPIYTTNQGKSGWIIEEIIDNAGNAVTVASMYVADTRMSILNKVEFKPLLAIAGFTNGVTTLKAGLSFSSLVTGNTINASSESASALVDPIDGNLTTINFVRTDKNSTMTGSLSVTGEDGIVVGPSSNFATYIDVSGGEGAYKAYLSSQTIDAKLILETRSSLGFDQSIEIDPSTKTMSLYPNDDWADSTPQFYVNGDTTIEGSLIVIGSTQFTNSTTLQITDKNIELAVVETPTNTTANGAGITVLGGAGNNKTITWLSGAITVAPPTNQLPGWSFSDNLKIPTVNSFYVGNNQVLSSTTLGSSVVNSSLTSVGELTSLTVSNFNFSNSTITVDSGLDLTISIDSGKIIELANRVRITNLDTPQADNDAATKEYVDNVKKSINYLTIDITGYATPNIDAVAQIDGMIPATGVNIGDVVRVLCIDWAVGPTPIRTIREFKCELNVGVRTWVYQTSPGTITV
jgi:hypothetical protein